VRRAILLACPYTVCAACGAPRQRVVRRTARLDPARPQACRATELAQQAGLTPEHIAAIQATGVSDAGKALLTQTGTGRNATEVRRLAAEAKAVLGGYFREFTFARCETVGWTTCDCTGQQLPGVVLDPFMGTGTSLKTALEMGRSAIGVDLDPAPWHSTEDPPPRAMPDVGGQTVDLKPNHVPRACPGGLLTAATPVKVRPTLVASSTPTPNLP
jgi:hypothetical protein